MGEFTSFMLKVVNGLTFAGLLFVIASGFTLIFGLMRVVNMAHGVFYLLGAYISYTVAETAGLSWYLAIVAAIGSVVILAFILEKLVKRVNGDMPQTLLTLGFGVMIQTSSFGSGAATEVIDPPNAIRKPIELFGFTYPGYRYFVLVVAVLIGVGLWLLLQKTQLGRIIRAGVDNRIMVSALGINIDRIFTQVFLLGGLLIGVAGVLGGSFLAFGPGKENEILLFALMVVIIGGLGSVPGSAVGAIIVGLVDSFGRSYFSEFAIFLLSGTLIVVLAFRPQGLFGKGE